MKVRVKIKDDACHLAAAAFSMLITEESKYVKTIKASQYNDTTTFVIKFINNCSEAEVRDLIFTCLQHLNKFDFIYSIKFYSG